MARSRMRRGAERPVAGLVPAFGLLALWMAGCGHEWSATDDTTDGGDGAPEEGGAPEVDAGDEWEVDAGGEPGAEAADGPEAHDAPSEDGLSPDDSAACETTVDVGPFRETFDEEYRLHRTEFDAMAASGRGDEYYTFQYVLDATLCMYEATGDTVYLERTLAWAETMVSLATIIDRNGNRNWSGDWESPYSGTPISYQLWDLQGSTELARLARIVATDPALLAAYGARSASILDFVRNDIVEKHLTVRGGLDWFRSDVATPGEPMNDKSALLLRILADVYRTSGEYADLIDELATGFRSRLQPYEGALIWDLGLSSEGYTAMDTSHANRFPSAVVALYQAGRVFTAAEVTGLSRLLSDVIWNGSHDDPRFTNFIDGSNGVYEGREPWGNGAIYFGWVALGEYDALVQDIGEAVLAAIQAGARNPSLDYNNTPYGRLELAGHLAKNRVALCESE